MEKAQAVFMAIILTMFFGFFGVKITQYNDAKIALQAEHAAKTVAAVAKNSPLFQHCVKSVLMTSFDKNLSVAQAQSNSF